MPGVYVARCQLRDDMTWALEADKDLADNPEVMQALQQHINGFFDLINTSAPLAETLPFYAADLPFFPRLLASGLARSLRSELHRGGAGNESGQALLDASGAGPRLLHILPESGNSPL